MKRVLQMWLLALAVLVGVSADARPAAQEGSPRSHGEMSSRLSRHGSFGRIHVQGGRKHFPEGAEVSIERKRPDDVKRKIHQGWSKRKRSGKSAASPNILASYDISIRHGGRKWQPDAGDPVRVTVDLGEPVAVTAASTLGVVHLSDDGTVEELPASRCGFTYNADKTAVTAFWFSASGFSIYSIIDNSGVLVTPRRFYHFYDRPTSIAGSAAVSALPYRYVDSSNEIVNVQIVKDGDALVEPPIPPDVVDVNSNLVSTFEGWYVVSNGVHTTMHGLAAAEGKLDSTTVPFEFVWPTGVTSHRLSFTNTVAFAEGETGDTDYFVVPLYEHSRFVQFYESAEEDMQAGSVARIVGRRLVALNDETHSMRIKVSDVTAPLRNSRGEYFSGWEYYRHRTDAKPTQILTYSAQGVAQEAFLEVDDALFEENRTEENGGHTIPMWPVYVEAHFLSFSPALPKGSGATYVGSLFVKSDTDIRSVETSARPGYEFGGWWTGTNNGDDKVPDVVYGQQVTDANGVMLANLSSLTNALGETVASTDANGKISLNTDVTLYAKWIPLPNTTYRVIIWQQKVTDAKNAESKTYDYVTHYTSDRINSENAITESMLRSFSGTNSLKSHVSGLNVLNASALNGRSEVEAAGVSFTGFETTAEWAATNLEANGHIKSDNSTVVNVYFNRKLITLSFYRDNRLSDQMTGLYGQTLAENGYSWPSGVWQTSKDGTTTTITFLDGFLPTTGEDEQYNYSSSSSGSYPISFYKQALDGSYGAAANTVNANGSNFNISDKYNGFTAWEYRKKTNSNGSWGSWTSAGTLDESTGYYGSPVSSYRALEIHFARNTYAFTFRDADTGEDVFTTNMMFEASLAGLNLSSTDARIDWHGRDTEHYTFGGWYEDASCTVAFDFASGKMSGAPKTVYAKWEPVKYKVIIDPNGGELHGDDSTWFYIDYNELVNEYVPTRNFRLDMSGAYYYSYHPYNELGDKHVTPTDSAEFIPNISRRAYYTTNVDEATDTFNRYAYEEGAYRFMGWYEVKEDGTLESAPFAFGTRHNRPLTIRALWQRSGLYILKYESIDPAGEHETEIWFDPENGTGGYISEGVTTLSKDPTNYDREEYIWEGWQVVDPRQNNLPLTNIRSPGDVYIVHASHADSDNVIHMRAVYSRKASGTSSHVPDVVDLVLDSNDGAGLVPGFSVDPALSGVGTYTGGTAGNISGLNQGVWFAGRQNNFSVNLADYASAFTHGDGFLLLGWDTNRVSTTGIPAYYANETIGIDKSTSQENVLYAVWEPQIYIELVNDTGDDMHDILLYIPEWYQGTVYKVPSVADIYHREVFTPFADGEALFDLPAGTNLVLVVPNGQNMDFTLFGTNAYTAGTKLVATRISPDAETGAQDGTAVAVAYPGERGVVSGTMRVSPVPVKVRFTKETYPTETSLPVRYFLHVPDGSVTEITHDGSYWNSSAYVTNLTVRAPAIDLAARLGKSAGETVNAFLKAEIQEEYAHTTIGIGAAEGAFQEYRSVTKRLPYGGSYVRFVSEHLQWSRYSQVWNNYADAAVYVVFYKRTPVHFTVAKSIVGTDSDKARKFQFVADFTERSDTYDYTTTERFKRVRTVEYTRRSRYSSTWTESSTPDWDDQPQEFVDSTISGAPVKRNASNQYLFSESRAPEEFSLSDGGRIPITLFYNEIPGSLSTNAAASSFTYEYGDWEYYHAGGWFSDERWDDDPDGSTRRRRVETRYFLQPVQHSLTYQYETATIREKTDGAENFNLASIAVSTNGLNSAGVETDLPVETVANPAAWSHDVSSLAGPDSSGFYNVSPLSTLVFTNSRKTGDVTISKAVVGDYAGESFDFQLKLEDETVIEKGTYVPPTGVTLGPYGKVFSFSLGNGGSVTIPGLPAGASYTVTERSGYAKYISDCTSANDSGTIPEGATTVSFVNTRKTDLAIAINDLTLEYNGAEQRGHDISTVEGAGSTPVAEDAYSVTGLKSGDVLTVQHHVPAQGKAVGSYAGNFNNARITVARSATGEDVTGEYLVTTTPGSLTIVPAQLVVTIVGNTDTRPWNATEQAVEGYTYTVVRKSDSSPVSDDEVHPVIEPAYSKAKGTDVGTYYMSLLGGAAVGFVKDDGYQIAPEDIHVTNGSLTITPRPATVTADDKAKILGASDPALTATVDGLLNSDTLSYTLSRAPGEAEGTYAITASGAADQGNYTVTYAPGTFTIRPLTLIQRATGEGLPVTDAVGGSLLASLGIANPDDATPEVVDGLLNQMDPNGLRRWENLRTGTEPTQLLLSTAAAGTSQIAAQMAADPGAVVDLGYTMLRELRKEQNGTWVRVAGPAAAGNPSFPIGLEDEGGNSVDASGLYRVVTLLVPNQNLAITNEIPSTNIIGVLEINNAVSNTITAVPWKQLASDPVAARDVTVSNFVAALNLSAGDAVYTLDAEQRGYRMWNRQADGIWEPVTTVRTADDGSSQVLQAESADAASLPRGNAVWVKRADTTKPYFLVGQYDEAEITVEVPGKTAAGAGLALIAIPTFKPLYLNKPDDYDGTQAYIDWSKFPVDAADQIRVPVNGVQTSLEYKNGKWGYYVTTTTYNEKRKKNVISSTFTPYTGIIPAGTGFFYFRMASEGFTFSWK